jgi:CPA1 family monovalent cation:H+ antiporter
MIHYAVVSDSGLGAPATCSHRSMIRHLPPAFLASCGECVREGLRWVHLRQCLTCGHVGCCDDSPGRHATAHWHTDTHPLIRSVEPGETWAWCYADEFVLVPSGHEQG